MRAFSANRLREAQFHNAFVPVDGGRFAVTDEALVDFCVRECACTSVLCGKLLVSNGSFTKDLFKRLVEASAVSKRTRWLRIEVSPSPVGEEDLRDFAQHLSYRNRGKRWQYRIYDFPGEQQGPDAAMDTQIVLDADNKLVLTRAQRPHRQFLESDE